jgi:hypothetical protein
LVTASTAMIRSQSLCLYRSAPMRPSCCHVIGGLYWDEISTVLQRCLLAACSHPCVVHGLSRLPIALPPSPPSTRSTQMAEAQRRIVPLGESAEYIPQCQCVLYLLQCVRLRAAGGLLVPLNCVLSFTSVLVSCVCLLRLHRYIIEHSTSAYALLIGAQSLTRLITSHWNSFTVPQRVDIRTCACRLHSPCTRTPPPPPPPSRAQAYITY